MDENIALVYINFLCLKDPNFDTKKASMVLWRGVISTSDNAEQLKYDFYRFIEDCGIDYGLDKWPISRFLEVWCV